jgi:hypothetical protein
MIQVKIQCGCGQPYAFDVEPILGQMPAAVACPTCGADGTAAANAYLAQTSPSPKPVIVVPTRPTPVRVTLSTHSVASAPAAPAPASRAAPAQAAELDPAQIEHEARAKILWGDEPDEVIKHLIIKGVDADEAAAMVYAMLKERASAIRVNGTRKMVIGSALVCVPIAALIVFMKIGVVSFTILGITGAVGVWGAWMMFKGIFMLLAPKSEAGDVSEQ